MPVCGNYLFFELPKKIVLNPKDGSLDDGVIRTANGEVPIAELEIELYSGDQEDMVRLGEELAAKYNLAAGDCSKFQKGLALLRG